MSGTIGILNVGAGDTKLTFDPKNPSEVARTSRIVKDMLRRGYALLIEIGKDEKGEPKYARAKDFDEKHCEYIIADFNSEVAAAHDKEEASNVVSEEPVAAPPAKKARQGVGRKKETRIPASSARGIAVSRVSGG